MCMATIFDFTAVNNLTETFSNVTKHVNKQSFRKQYESILFMLIRMFQAALEESSATDFLASSAV